MTARSASSTWSAATTRRSRRRAGEDAVTFGLAEFVAAEEMGRSRGYWWSPDGSQLLIARVDESPVRRWHIADPANPDKAPAEVRYPAAGTPNADVSLLLATIARRPATAPRPSSKRSTGTGPPSPT